MTFFKTTKNPGRATLAVHGPEIFQLIIRIYQTTGPAPTHGRACPYTRRGLPMSILSLRNMVTRDRVTDPCLTNGIGAEGMERDRNLSPVSP